MKQLLELYTSKINEFKAVKLAFPDDDIAGPFLISPNSLYFKQRKKLLIIGQQTKGWTYEIDDITKQMESYTGFNLGINYYSSPFWNITRKLEVALGISPFSCAWTNINKFDFEADRPFEKLEESISKLDYILLEEIKILVPDICMFYTGPDFDARLKQIFPGIKFNAISGWGLRQFCKLEHSLLPLNTYRSYHPKSLRIRYLEEDFINYMSKLSFSQ
jgi:hypothetical protein